MSCVAAHDEGALLRVRALPGAKQDRVREIHRQALVVAIHVVAEKGRANLALREFLAKRLGLRKSQLELQSGATARDKQFLVRGIDAPELQRRIDALLSQQT